MDIKCKIKLILRYEFTPDDIHFIESLGLENNFEMLILKDDFSKFAASLESLLNKENNEDKAIRIAYNLSKVLKVDSVVSYINALAEEEDVIDDNNNELINSNAINEEHEYRQVTPEQKKSQRQAVAKYKEIQIEKIADEFFKYTMDNFPDIKNGFDRSIYGRAKDFYWRNEGFYSLWEIPTKVYEKIKSAELAVENSLKDFISIHANNMFETWYSDYCVWLNNSELKKSTKQNIKEYFKEKKIKATDTMIERIKEKYKSV
jgi:hypothetical protein